jgi:hypothetical protein
MHRLAYAPLLATALLVAAPANAEPVKGFFFRLERDSTNVDGLYVIGGYSPAQVVSMMRQYCKGGQIGDFAHVGRARKRKGQVLQKFRTTCAGGKIDRLDRFGGKTTGFEIEYITEGQYAGEHLVEITGSDGLGNIIHALETTTP